MEWARDPDFRRVAHHDTIRSPIFRSGIFYRLHSPGARLAGGTSWLHDDDLLSHPVDSGGRAAGTRRGGWAGHPERIAARCLGHAYALHSAGFGIHGCYVRSGESPALSNIPLPSIAAAPVQRLDSYSPSCSALYPVDSLYTLRLCFGDGKAGLLFQQSGRGKPGIRRGDAGRWAGSTDHCDRVP